MIVKNGRVNLNALFSRKKKVYFLVERKTRRIFRLSYSLANVVSDKFYWVNYGRLMDIIETETENNCPIVPVGLEYDDRLPDSFFGW